LGEADAPGGGARELGAADVATEPEPDSILPAVEGSRVDELPEASADTAGASELPESQTPSGAVRELGGADVEPESEAEVGGVAVAQEQAEELPGAQARASGAEELPESDVFARDASELEAPLLSVEGSGESDVVRVGMEQEEAIPGAEVSATSASELDEATVQTARAPELGEASVDEPGQAAIVSESVGELSDPSRDDLVASEEEYATTREWPTESPPRPQKILSPDLDTELSQVPVFGDFNENMGPLTFAPDLPAALNIEETSPERELPWIDVTGDNIHIQVDRRENLVSSTGSVGTQYVVKLIEDPDPGPGANGQGVAVRVKEIFNDYYRCRTWDGTVEGVNDLLAAKHFKLRHVLANYPQLTSLVTVDTQTVTASDGGTNPDETWKVTPDVELDDEISIKPAPAGGSGVLDGAGDPVPWVVDGEEPDWAVGV